MKRFTEVLAVLAALIAPVSCGKEDNGDAGSYEPMTISAVSEPIGTKARTEYRYDLLWREGDRITVLSGNAGDSFKLSDGAGTVKGTFVQEGETSLDGDVEAFYPSSLVDGTSLVWPSVQTEDLAIPMYSRGACGGAGPVKLGFSSLGSVLRIVFSTAEKDVLLKSITVRDGLKTLSGTFTVRDGLAEMTSATRTSVTLDLGAGVQVGLAPKVFCLAVPAGDYKNLRIIFRATDDRICVFTGGQLNLEGNTSGLLTLAANEFKPAGTIPGKFSVDSGRIVMFSKGNLWYDGSVFRFFDRQYEFSKSYDPASGVSHFLWDPDYSKALMTALPSTDRHTRDDMLFTNLTSTTPNPDFTVNGVKGRFRTLDTGEWQYLLGYGRGYKYVECARVFSSIGLLLLPDDYVAEAPTRISDEQALKNAEEDGVVFLPGAGYRDQGSVITGTSAVEGRYWTSTILRDPEYSPSVQFKSTGQLYPRNDCSRNAGNSIRLVTE